MRVELHSSSNIQRTRMGVDLYSPAKASELAHGHASVLRRASHSQNIAHLTVVMQRVCKASARLDPAERTSYAAMAPWISMARWRWKPSSAASSAAVGSTTIASCGCRLHGSRKRLPPPRARRDARLARALARFSRMLSRAHETLLATTREAAPATLCTYARRNELATCGLNSCITPRR